VPPGPGHHCQLRNQTSVLNCPITPAPPTPPHPARPLPPPPSPPTLTQPPLHPPHPPPRRHPTPSPWHPSPPLLPAQPPTTPTTPPPPPPPTPPSPPKPPPASQTRLLCPRLPRTDPRSRRRSAVTARNGAGAHQETSLSRKSDPDCQADGAGGRAHAARALRKSVIACPRRAAAAPPEPSIGELAGQGMEALHEGCASCPKAALQRLVPRAGLSGRCSPAESRSRPQASSAPSQQRARVVDPVDLVKEGFSNSRISYRTTWFRTR